MKRLIVIAGAVVIILFLTIVSVFYLPYGIGYMQTIKKHCEDAKRDITSAEFTGEIINIKKDLIYIKLEEPLLFNKLLPIEYPYKNDEKARVLQMIANKTILHYAKIGMSIDKMYGSDSIVVNNRSFAIYNKKYGRW